VEMVYYYYYTHERISWKDQTDKRISNCGKKRSG